MDVEPEWIPLTVAGSGYEQEIDLRAAEGSPWQYRHRPRAHTGQAEPSWKPGPAPDFAHT